jgi:hypothetical protein
MIGRRNMNGLRREEIHFRRQNRPNESHKDQIKKKVTSKCLEDRTNFLKELFSTDKGKALLEAIKKKAAVFVTKGEKDKVKIGQKIIKKFTKSKNNMKNDISNVLRMYKMLKGWSLKLLD